MQKAARSYLASQLGCIRSSQLMKPLAAAGFPEIVQISFQTQAHLNSRVENIRVRGNELLFCSDLNSICSDLNLVCADLNIWGADLNIV